MGRERDTLDVRLIYILYKKPVARKRFKIFTQICHTFLSSGIQGVFELLMLEKNTKLYGGLVSLPLISFPCPIFHPPYLSSTLFHHPSRGVILKPSFA